MELDAQRLPVQKSAAHYPLKRSRVHATFCPACLCSQLIRTVCSRSTPLCFLSKVCHSCTQPSQHFTYKLDDGCLESRLKNDVNFTFSFYVFFVFFKYLYIHIYNCYSLSSSSCSSSLSSSSSSSYSYSSSSDSSSASYSSYIF